MKIIKKTFFLALITILTFSCSKKSDEKSNAEIAYTEAFKKLKDKSYSDAADAFEKIDDDYPFSKWAVKGQSMSVYARYKDHDYPALLQVSDDFLRLNPSSEYVPYMLYMRGLTYYNQIPDIERAQGDTQQASFIFRELIARFPENKRSIDAKTKLPFIDEHLSGAKMSIGRYQISSKNYIGAITNFNTVISRYHRTSQVPEAYLRLAEIYYKIGLNQEGAKAAEQLRSRFPESEWIKPLNKISSAK